MKMKRQNSVNKPSWKKVKLSGPVISDEGADLAGLIGLEILEGYDKGLVKKEKKKRILEVGTDKEKDSGLDSEDSSDSDVPKKKKKAAKKEKKFEADSDLEPEPEEKKSIKQKNKEKVIEAKAPVNNTPGQFVLLKKTKKKPTVKKGEEQEATEDEIPSSVYSKWSELGVTDLIIKALADKNYIQPTQIQSLSIPAAIFGKRDILGAAETGSGKTLAFGIPLLQGILKLKKNEGSQVAERNHDDRDLTPPPEELEYFPKIKGKTVKLQKEIKKDKPELNKPLYALILTPTRELAVQIHDHLKDVAKYTGIKIAKVFGGLAAVKQERMLKQCPEIVVATPGRLWELIKDGNKHLNKIDMVKYLVIDETDRMLEKGHFDELKELLTRINSNEEMKAERRNYIFSATLTMVHGLPDYIKGKKGASTKIVTPGQKLENLKQMLGMTDPKVIDITQEHGTAQTLTESRVLCKADHKDFYLYYFLKRHPGRTLVFCNSIDCVKRLSSLFSFLRCDPLTLYGSMIQKQRLKNLEKFTKNPSSVLFATDVAARGLDIPNVEHVIHYQVPKTSENYVHRSGRTARASNEGIAVLFIAPTEIKDYLKLNQALGRKDDLPLYPISDRMFKQVKERVILAREIEVVELKQRRTNENSNWKMKVSEDFGSDSDSEKDSDIEEERKLAQNKEKRKLKVKRATLNQLLSAPMISDGYMSLKFPTNAASTLTDKENSSAITLVKKVVEENINFRKERNKKRKFNN